MKILNYTMRLILAFGITFLVVFSDLPEVLAASKATTIAELKDELADLKSQKAQAESQKAQAQSDISANKNNMYSAYKQQEEIANQVEEAKNKISESETKIESTTKDLDSILKYYQITDNDNIYMEYITGASTPTDLIMRISAVEQLTSYYQDMIKNLKDLILEKQNLQVELDAKNTELDQKIDNYSDAISALNNQLSEYNELNEDIDSQIKNQQALINYYKTVCTSETQKLSDCVSVAASAGWLRPLVKGKITSGWGYRVNPLTGKAMSFHNAYDIGGNPEGTPVYAAAAGTVAAVTVRSSCGGNIIYIHVNVGGEAYTTQYAHLLTINVKVGDKVTSSTQIGSIGGGSQTKSYDKCSTGAHLHFGVSKGYYLGGGADGYSSWSRFIANSVEPKGFPKIGVYWYKRA